MADLIREVRRATLIAMKGNAALTAIVPAASIHPGTVPADHLWPFTRWDGPDSIPLDGACFAGATVSFAIHFFGKPRYESSAMIETAEDHVSRMVTAGYKVLHRNRLAVTGGTVRLRCASARLMQDTTEADAYHGIIAVTGRALAS